MQLVAFRRRASLGSRASVPAVVLALALAGGAAAVTFLAAPPTGQWSRVGPAVPKLFPTPSSNEILGAEFGPDGRLYVFGSFSNASGDPTADNLAVYDPGTGLWTGLGSNGAGDGALGGTVYDITWVNGTLYAGGDSIDAGGVVGADYLAAWNGSTWTKRGASLNGKVLALASRNGALYAGGMFTDVDGHSWIDHVAMFDGYAWHGMGFSGAGSDPALGDTVRALQVLPDGRMFAAGDFTNAGANLNADHVAWWDPGAATWNAVGGVAGPDGLFSPGTLNAVAVVGSKVYVGGSFDNANGDFRADNVAVWSGSDWTNLGSNAAGTDGAITDAVTSLAVYGSNVIAAGSFLDAGGNAAADTIAAWNGTKWLPLGVPNQGDVIDGLAISGRTLVATGYFSSIGGAIGTDRIAAFGLPAAPTAPRSLAGTAGSKRVTLTWAAPATANGSVVKDYVVQYRKLGATTWKTFVDGVRITRSAVVTGLTSGTTYQFRVQGKNDWGTGAPSTVVAKKAG